MKTLQNTVYESSTGLPFVPGAKYKLPKFGHPQKIKVWLLGLNKTRLPWQLPLLSFFIACYTFLARFCYFTFCMVWQVFGKTFKDSKSAWRKWFFIGFFRSIYLTRSFFAYYFLEPVVMESWMVWKISSIVPVTWQSGTVDEDPNGRKLGTPPYNYGHSNPPLITATSLVRPNSYGLIVATLEGSLPPS